jgi:hypothetical protein
MVEVAPAELVAEHLARCLKNSPTTRYVRITREEARLLIRAVIGEQVS